MKVSLEYGQAEYLPTTSVAVIGSFNQYDKEKGQMTKRDGKWVFEVELAEGEHYYRFLVNGILELNDPNANIYLPNDKEELWSTIIINNKNDRVWNDVQYKVHLEKYNMTNNVYDEQMSVNKKDFNLSFDKKVVTRFEFGEVTGLHTVTAVWLTPYGQVFEYQDNLLFKPEEDIPLVLWYWLDFTKSNEIYEMGKWTLKLFIDGTFMLEDYLNLNSAKLYGQQ